MTPDDLGLVKAIAEGTAKGATDAVLEPLKAVFMPFCKEIGEGLRTWGEQFKERMRATGVRATKMLADVGKEPEFISLKLFVPIAQNSGLEEDATLQEAWAAMLANAANPDHAVKVHPAYPDTLKKLTPDEAQLANNIYGYVCFEIKQQNLPRHSVSAKHIELWQAMNGYGTIHTMDVSEIQPMIDHLQTLGLITNAVVDVVEVDGNPAAQVGEGALRMTAFGFEFVTACQAPGPIPWW